MIETTQLSPNLISKTLLNADYETTHEAMLARTLERIEKRKTLDKQAPDVSNPNTRNSNAESTDIKNTATKNIDELWIVEHKDVYTLGQAGKEEHILSRNNTPIIKTDRGGQVTWHGKGQLVVYWLFDLTALNWKVRDLVSHAEQAIEDVVNAYLPDELVAKARADAPGVYIFQRDKNNSTGDMLGKIASLGFKIKHGFSYHGIALNLTCDLTAFNLINPCGYAGMQMLRLADFADIDPQQVTQALIANIKKRHSNEIALR